MINRAVLAGSWPEMLEVRKLKSGTVYTACGAEWVKMPHLHQPTADLLYWRQSADFLGSMLVEWNVVALDGHIQTGSYERDGQRIYTTGCGWWIRFVWFRTFETGHIYSNDSRIVNHQIISPILYRMIRDLEMMISVMVDLIYPQMIYHYLEKESNMAFRKQRMGRHGLLHKEQHQIYWL